MSNRRHTTPRRPAGPRRIRGAEYPRVPLREGRTVKYLRWFAKQRRRLRPHRNDPNRRLHFDQYVAWMLLYFFLPSLTSMRSTQRASKLAGFRARFRLPRFSLGSFSEASSRFDPEELVPLIEGLYAQAAPRPEYAFLQALPGEPTAVDGSLLHALPRMVWALWIDDEHRAAKLHLQFDLLRGVPREATLTEGNGDERKVLREHLAAGRLYVFDGGYADYGLLAAIQAAKSSFVGRLRCNASYEVHEERDVSPAARAAGVERDLVVKLGCASSPELHDRDIRLVQVHLPDTTGGRPRTGRRTASRGHRYHTNEHTLLLATDLLGLPAEVVAELYRYRWQIELFFRWFKKVLGAEHLVAERPNGVKLMVYCALLASLLVSVVTGSEPTRETFELIGHYLTGLATEEDLEALAPTEISITKEA